MIKGGGHEEIGYVIWERVCVWFDSGHGQQSALFMLIDVFFVCWGYRYFERIMSRGRSGGRKSRPNPPPKFSWPLKPRRRKSGRNLVRKQEVFNLSFARVEYTS